MMRVERKEGKRREKGINRIGARPGATLCVSSEAGWMSVASCYAQLLLCGVDRVSAGATRRCEPRSDSVSVSCDAGHERTPKCAFSFDDVQTTTLSLSFHTHKTQNSNILILAASDT